LSSSEIVLKVLAHNNFIGRIIGKGGNIINTIKKETETKFVDIKFFLFYFFSLNSITVSSINELNTYNIERIISIKGEFDQQIRALETIYAKLCLAYENDNARAWNYSSQYYQQQQQQQLMQHFAQQAAMMATGGPTLLPTHYPQQQSIIHPTQTNNSNGSSSKYIEQQPNTNAIYQPSYYVSFNVFVKMFFFIYF
jgi:hypothetical protein